MRASEPVSCYFHRPFRDIIFSMLVFYAYGLRSALKVIGSDQRSVPEYERERRRLCPGRASRDLNFASRQSMQRCRLIALAVSTDRQVGSGKASSVKLKRHF